MWLKLTDIDGNPILLNMDLVLSVQETGNQENFLSLYCPLDNVTIKVKEEFKQIQRLMYKQLVNGFTQ